MQEPIEQPSTTPTLFQQFKQHPVTRLFVTFILFIIGLFLLGLAIELFFTEVLPEHPTIQTGRGILILITMFFFYRFLMAKLEKRTIDELNPTKALSELGTGVLFALIMVAVIVASIALAGGYRITEFHIPTTLWYTLCWLPVYAVSEELIFRGILFRQLNHHYGKLNAYVISAVVFGLLHLSNESAELISGISATLGGILMCIAYDLTKRLWVPIGFHIGWNFGQAFMGSRVSGSSEFGQFFVAEFSGPAWLIGIDGIETSYITLALLVAAISFGYRKTRQQ